MGIKRAHRRIAKFHWTRRACISTMRTNSMSGWIAHMYTTTSVTAAGDDNACTPAAAVDGQLLRAARSGNRAALQTLYGLCLPTLRRWAHRYLPRGCGGINDADDLVQIALLRALKHLGDFEVRSDASF